MAAEPSCQERLGVLAAILLLIQQHDIRRKLRDPRDLGLFPADLLDRFDQTRRMYTEFCPSDKRCAEPEVEDQLSQRRTKRDYPHAA